MAFEVPVTNRISLHGNHGLWAMIFLLATLLQIGDQVGNWRYDRHLIEYGHLWLLASGNFVHLNWQHWGLNMAGLAIVAFFFSCYGSVTRWLVLVAASSFCVGIGLYLWNPEVKAYVGLSGVLHGLFIYGALCEVRRYPWSGYALLLLLSGKLTWEILYGAVPGSEALTSGRVATDAHLYGAICGLTLSLAWLLFDKLVKVENGQEDAEYD